MVNIIYIYILSLFWGFVINNATSHIHSQHSIVSASYAHPLYNSRCGLQKALKS
jgi:hypothetical protein